MLELYNIVKDYPVAGDCVHALKGISLQFRKNEFVAVLGPSGCGKTTMLNIIGGLDQYTKGDLVINGKSTKDFKDRDWDSYRNHSIGFVFQSYNLIPHQSVLQNVELALTLSGVSKKERKARAIDALKSVGLENQIHKKPSEMSGGQMQRVAIARALVNNPDIILADEPTGALDSETSIQVMDILKEVARDRLVIMVTHNPELAQQYATRIIRMLDGVVQDDSMPLSDEETVQLRREDANASEMYVKKPSMSYATSFLLSLKNLFTKKGRTILTSFAGSIGIIGIALIYAVSQGMTNYIDTIQQDTLSTYPLTITSETADMASILTSMSTAMGDTGDAEGNQVVESRMMASVLGQVGTNDLISFKTYLDSHLEEVRQDMNALAYSYGITPQIYTKDCNNELLQVNPSTLFSSMVPSSYSAYMSGFFNQMVDNETLLDSQYDMLSGRWPQSYDEMVLVLLSPNSMSDMLAYTVGLRDPGELSDLIGKIMDGEEVELEGEPLEWTYDDLRNLEFKLILETDTYEYSESQKVWEDMSDDEDYMNVLYDSATELHVVGIVSPKNGVSATALEVGFNYHPDLIFRLIDQAKDTEIVQQQLADEEIDVFTGKTFESAEEDNGLDFESMINVDENMLQDAFGNIDADEIQTSMTLSIGSVGSFISSDTSGTEAAFQNAFSSLSRGMFTYYLSQHQQNVQPVPMALLTQNDATTMADEYLSRDASAAGIVSSFDSQFGFSSDTFSSATIFKSMWSAVAQSYYGTMSLVPIKYAYDNMSVASQTDLLTTLAASGVQKEDLDAVASFTSLAPYITAAQNIIPGSVPVVNTTGTDSAGTYLDAFLVSSTMKALYEQMAIKIQDASMTMKVSSYMGGSMVGLLNQVMKSFQFDEDTLAEAFNFSLGEDELNRIMNAFSRLSSDDVTARSNLQSLGYADVNDPTMIAVYLVDFDAKEHFLDFLDNYNDQMEAEGKEDQVLSYTDLTGVLMSSVSTIINAITYVLIAFVSISLVVSSIMIGVITLISVQERTKEIGILRAIGASKRNVSNMFNAETMIIGFASGLIGIIVTYLLCIPINAILHQLTGIDNLSAQLPLSVGIILIIISMSLTLLAGIIPSRSAAKKDPVVALRTE